jgi:dUTPase
MPWVILCHPFRETARGASPGPEAHPFPAGLGDQSAENNAPTFPCSTQLLRTNPGSTGLDLCTSTSTILKHENGVQVLPTGVFGPPPRNMFFLTLGHASSTIKGLIVHPSQVDNDFTGEIKILASSSSGPILLPQGHGVAQALPLPLNTQNPVIGRAGGGLSATVLRSFLGPDGVQRTFYATP